MTRSQNPRGRGGELRTQLVAAARELLLAPREAAPFSLRAVAKAVGVSPTAVYRHFDSADDLVTAVLSDQDAMLRDVLGFTGAGFEPSRSTIAIAATRYVGWGLANPGAYQLLFESADRLGHRGGPGTPGWDMIEALAAMLERLLEISSDEATVRAIRTWSALHGLTSLRLHKPRVGWPTTIEQEVDAIVEGLLL